MKNYFMRSLIKNLLPPIIYKKLKLLLGKKGTYFTGEYKSWDDTLVHCKGYDDKDILKKVINSTLKVKRGEMAYERDGILFERIEYSWQVLTGIIWVAARNSGRLCVLDIGGSLGTTYFQNNRFLNEINLSSWNIVEQKHYVKAGRAQIQDEILRFHDSIENCLNECDPNVILISNSLQYMPDPQTTIDSLANIGADAIIFDRTIINNSKYNKIYVQHATPLIGGSYPCYTISEQWLINKLKKKYYLVESFDSPLFPESTKINSTLKGYIFSKKNIKD
jgi:putative methyltransferase (TIGR04325 family)